MKKTGISILLLLILTGFGSTLIYAGVADGKHNLSSSGTGTIKATSESEICVFCHTPHNSSPSGPLWNKNNSGTTYTPYTSSTIATSPGAPTGDSILCLSCHDGTIALGELVSRTTDVTITGGPFMPAGPTNLSNDLSDDHPVSFSYSSSQSAKPSELVSPATLTGAVKLDNTGQLQCTSCHDAHDDQFGKFLVMSRLNGALCLACHTKAGWSASSHSTSNSLWNNGQTVASNACQSCHVPHSAPAGERLLRSSIEENVCFSCHDGSVAVENIQIELTKFSRHAVGDTTGIHDPTETAIVNSRHVECADCHNPHAAAATGTPSGPLELVRGVNFLGNEVDPIAQEYEVCFRCHADSTGKLPPPTARNPYIETNARLEFATTNTSYHPVLGSIANTGNTPSLIGTTGSTIKCTDCHTNNNIAGPGGPHGSDFPQLLVRRNETADFTIESASNYALCYGCHSQTSILNDVGFKEHNKHILGADTNCNTCHDPHGSDQPRLINFDTSIVAPNGNGDLYFLSQGPGTGKGECGLLCHGKDHKPKSY